MVPCLEGGSSLKGHLQPSYLGDLISRADNCWKRKGKQVRWQHCSIRKHLPNCHVLCVGMVILKVTPSQGAQSSGKEGRAQSAQYAKCSDENSVLWEHTEVTPKPGWRNQKRLSGDIP
ncbi:unnamed protein product [Gulo gulo]|uniref:Uncharacterized protein n=1 Tax=Gulo gulo TaxID=48420 RepID=A0A9X9LWK3_GULGU|nr:unnamed protein product [Gulo gulo]